LLYRGKKIVVEERGGRPQLSIDGKPITTVNTNGAYRAAGFVFSPSDTQVELAKKMIDYQIALEGRP